VAGQGVRLGVHDLAEQSDGAYVASPGLWGMAIFMLLHIYAAIREDIASRQTMISAITTGHRFFRNDDP